MPACPFLWGWHIFSLYSASHLRDGAAWALELYSELFGCTRSNQGEIKLVSVSLALQRKEVRNEKHFLMHYIHSLSVFQICFSHGSYLCSVCFRSVCEHNPHFTHVITNAAACGMQKKIIYFIYIFQGFFIFRKLNSVLL